MRNAIRAPLMGREHTLDRKDRKTMFIWDWIAGIGQVRRRRFLLRDMPEPMLRDIGLDAPCAWRDARRLHRDVGRL